MRKMIVISDGMDSAIVIPYSEEALVAVLQANSVSVNWEAHNMRLSSKPNSAVHVSVCLEADIESPRPPLHHLIGTYGNKPLPPQAPVAPSPAQDDDIPF